MLSLVVVSSGGAENDDNLRLQPRGSEGGRVRGGRPVAERPAQADEDEGPAKENERVTAC